jgi:hypothetical protein
MEDDMSIEKKYLKTKNICKVTFHLPATGAGGAQTAFWWASSTTGPCIPCP